MFYKKKSLALSASTLFEPSWFTATPVQAVAETVAYAEDPAIAASSYDDE